MSDTVLKAIQLQAGMNKNTTEYNAEGGWTDGDKVRFRGGNAEKWGGWVKESIAVPANEFSSAFSSAFNISGTITATAITGFARDIKTWQTLAGQKLVAVATNTGIYLIKDTDIYDITPADFVPGLQSTGSLTGYGGGTYDTPGDAGGGYGMPRSGSAGSAPLQEWSLDNWGEDLIACANGGKIYQWVAANGYGTQMQIIANAPIFNSLIAVALPARFLVAFGSVPTATGVFDPLTIRWADQETLTSWDETFTDQAGEYRLPLGDYIVGVCQTRGTILVFTNSAVYTMTFVGEPDIFDFNIISTNAGLLSQHGATDVDGIIFWPGLNNFYAYNGYVSVLPSTVNQYIFDQNPADLVTDSNFSMIGRINRDQKAKAFGGTNKQFTEWILLYADQTSVEPNRYVTYNYLDQIWTVGSLDRAVWVDATIFDNPLAVDSGGNLFVHESGYDDNAAPMFSFIESAWFDMADGEILSFCDRIVPDFKIPENRSIQFYVETRKYPTSAIVTKGPYNINSTTEKVFIRARGRQMRIRIESNSSGGSYQTGKIRLGLQQDGGQ